MLIPGGDAVPTPLQGTSQSLDPAAASDAARRTRVLAVRLNAGEFDVLRKKAREAERATVAGWARDVLLNASSDECVRVGADEDIAIVGQLQRLGNNLNQLVKIAHAHGDFAMDELWDATEAVKSAVALVKKRLSQ